MTVGTAICPAPPQANAPQGDDESEHSTSSTLTVWPNPNNGDQLFMAVSEMNSELTTATVDIYDLFGKRVMTSTIATEGTKVIELNKQLAPGLYVVTYTAGEVSFTERLVIQ